MRIFKTVIAVMFLTAMVGAFSYIIIHWTENTDIIVVAMKIAMLLIGCLMGAIGGSVLESIHIKTKHKRRKKHDELI